MVWVLLLALPQSCQKEITVLYAMVSSSEKEALISKSKRKPCRKQMEKEIAT